MGKSKKNWYARNIGDYAKKTSHLSLLEHGAYSKLLDWYYANEKPLPKEMEILHRICTAFALEEQAAVQKIIDQFFYESAEGYRNKRADTEITKKRKISKVRREAQQSREEKRLQNECKNGANGGANDSAKHTVTTTTTTIEDVVCNAQAKTDFQRVYETGAQVFPNLAAASTASIHQWLAAGFDVELDIIPEITRQAGRGIKSWNFFTGAISTAHATRTSKPPEGEVNVRKSTSSGANQPESRQMQYARTMAEWADE